MTTAVSIASTAGDFFDFGGLGVRWKIDGPQTGERFSIVHHPIAPRACGAASSARARR